MVSYIIFFMYMYIALYKFIYLTCDVSFAKLLVILVPKVLYLYTVSVFAVGLWSPFRTMNRPVRKMATQTMRRPSNCQDSEGTESGMKKS